MNETQATTGDSQMKLKGIISAERPCECCGNNNLEKNVVFEREDGSLYYVGTTCAGYIVHGKKNRKNGKLVEQEALAHNYAQKWIAKYGTDNPQVMENIVSQIRVRYCPATIVDGRLLIGSEMELATTRK